MIQDIPTLPEEIRRYSGTEREKLWNAIQWVDKQNEITQDSVKKAIRRKEIEYQNDANKLLGLTLNKYRQLEEYEKQAIQQELLRTSVNDPDEERRNQADIKYNEFMRESLKSSKKIEKTKINNTDDLFKQLKIENEQLKEIEQEKAKKGQELKKTVDQNSDNESDLEDKEIQRKHNEFTKNLSKKDGKRVATTNHGSNYKKKEGLKPLIIQDEITSKETSRHHAKKPSIDSIASTSSIPSMHLNDKPTTLPSDYQDSYEVGVDGNLHQQGDIEIENNEDSYNQQETSRSSNFITKGINTGINYIFGRRKKSNTDLRTNIIKDQAIENIESEQSNPEFTRRRKYQMSEELRKVKINLT